MKGKECNCCGWFKSLRYFKSNRGAYGVCKSCQKLNIILKRYGITREYYDWLYEHQGRKCAICEMPARQSHLHIDHDHKTGQVRGLLCPACNKGLGMFRDRTSVLINAIRYLEIREIPKPEIREIWIEPEKTCNYLSMSVDKICQRDLSNTAQ